MIHETQNIFFISDLHIGHKNIISYDHRPFADLDEMNSEIIKRWNSVVKPYDVVYHLGDLSLGARSDMIKWFLFSLNGKIYHIMGNHDEKINKVKRYNRFEDIYEYGTEIWIKDLNNDDAKRSGGKQQIILSHYPILSWDRRRYGSWHLHGHSHQKLMTDPNFKWYYDQKVFDVGCSGIDYTPISYEKIKDIMLKKISIKEKC